MKQSHVFAALVTTLALAAGAHSAQASGFAIVGVAVWLRLGRNRQCEDIGIGVTGLAGTPFRAKSVEARLRGNKLTPKLIEESAAQVAEGSDPLEDLHASTDFRAHLARVYTSRAIQEAAKRADFLQACDSCVKRGRTEQGVRVSAWPRRRAAS